MFTLSQNGYGTHSAASMSRTELMTSIRQKKKPVEPTGNASMRFEGRILLSKHLQDSFLLPRRRPLEHGKVPFALAQHTAGGALALSQTRRYSDTHISGGEIFQATGESGGDFEIRRPSDQSN